MVGASSGNESVSIGYDPSGNTNGGFTGHGEEVLFRNGVRFYTPNAANNSWHNPLTMLDGNVGIGTTSPGAKLDVVGGISIDDSGTFALRRSQGTGMYAIHYAGVGPRYPIRFVGSSDSSTHRFFEFGYYAGDNQSNTWTANVVIDSYTGNVGIGTTSPSYPLHVSGSVRATSFISNSTTYADFVFKPDYRLAPLSEVEAAIKEHGHLPEIPSEAEAKDHGVDLAQMQTKLLQKVEELTLYAIANEKEVASQRRELQRLHTENAELQRRISELAPR